jgi:C-terminal processing protease CtpA/Prc
MPRFADTRGLIIDVRGNGGGKRTPLLALYPFLMGEEEPPQVVSAARYRLFWEFPRHHLDARFMRRADDRRLDPAEKRAIARFAADFRPEWWPPERRFSEWHYLVISRDPDITPYMKPVVVLMDDRCFSATDVFLGALMGRPGVTLMGIPSGGGSAFSQTFRLPNSKLEVKCASMASFQPTGELYDTKGIQPDVVIESPPEYYLEGGQDPFLAGAVERILE